MRSSAAAKDALTGGSGGTMETLARSGAVLVSREGIFWTVSVDVVWCRVNSKSPSKELMSFRVCEVSSD